MSLVDKLQLLDETVEVWWRPGHLVTTATGVTVKGIGELDVLRVPYEPTEKHLTQPGWIEITDEEDVRTLVEVFMGSEAVHHPFSQPLQDRLRRMAAS